MADLNEATLRELGRPFAPAALKFKVQATWPKEAPKNGLIVSYMDARLVTARLNLVVGPNWSTVFEPWHGEASAAVCHLTVFGVTRSDIGKGGGFEKEKAGFSDAFKRAATHFSIGAYLYSMSAVTLGASKEGSATTLRHKTANGKKTLELVPATEAKLRKGYEAWLRSDRNVWGDPLDHHDEEGAVGDPVEVTAPSEVDLELTAAKQEAQTLYAGQNGQVRKSIKPGMFRTQLEAASTTEDVDALIERVKAAAA